MSGQHRSWFRILTMVCSYLEIIHVPIIQLSNNYPEQRRATPMPWTKMARPSEGKTLPVSPLFP